MIYHRYHAARQEKFAAQQAALDSDIAEINGEVLPEVTAPASPPTAAAPQQAQQHQNHQQRNEQSKRR